ncbi:MAG: BrxA/BrxB family bacilliredoxin, partial [Candidatus Acidiferrales bacterium]
MKAVLRYAVPYGYNEITQRVCRAVEYSPYGGKGMSMYPEEMIRPMREELTSIGFREMRTPEEVDSILQQAKGATLVVV